MSRPAATATKWVVPKRALTRLPNDSLVFYIVTSGIDLNPINPVDNPQEEIILAHKRSFWYAPYPMESANQTADKLQERRAQAIEEIRKSYPPILTTALVAELMHCTIGDVRDKVHRGALPAVRWGQQFRFFREEVLAALEEVLEGEEEIASD